MIQLFQNQIVVGIIIFIATLVIDLLTDYRIWLRKKTVNHVRGVFLRGIGLVPAFILMGWKSLGLVFVYMVLFNGIYGLLIARDWFFAGTTSWTDRLLNQYPWLLPVLYALAVGGLAFFISSLIKP